MRFTLNITDPVHQELVELNIQDLAYRIANNTNTEISQILHSKGGYKYFLRLPLFSNFNYAGRNEETPHMVIKCCHKAGDRKFIAYEFKGHPYNKSEWYCARLYIEQTLAKELYKEYWSELLVTDVHIAVGSDIPLSHLLFDKLRARKAGIYFNSNGEMELIYMQPKNRTQELAIYDRHAKAKNRKLKFRPNEATRAELRLGKMRIPFTNFLVDHTYVDKFQSIKSYDFKKLADAKGLGRYELMAIQSMGLIPFMRKHTKYERTKLRKTIGPYLVPVININSIKSMWSKQISKISVMDQFKDIPASKEKKFKAMFNSKYL